MRDARDGVAIFMRDRGFKQTVIAAKAGLSDQILSDIVHKRRKMDANEMFRICQAMDVSPNELVEGPPLDDGDGGE